MTIYGRYEELVSRCIECNLAEPESLTSLCGSAPGLVDGILSQLSVSFYKMCTDMKDEIKAISFLPFSGLQSDWDEWSEKYQGIAAERGYLQVMLGNELVPSDSLVINQKVLNKSVIPDEDERKQKHLMRKLNQKGYRDLQLATTKLAFQLVSLAQTVNIPNGSLAKAWAALKDEYNPPEGEDKIKLLEDFQNNKLLNAKENITEWLASMSTQVMKLNKLSHSINGLFDDAHLGKPPSRIQLCGGPCQD